MNSFLIIFVNFKISCSRFSLFTETVLRNFVKLPTCWNLCVTPESILKPLHSHSQTRVERWRVWISWIPPYSRSNKATLCLLFCLSYCNRGLLGATFLHFCVFSAISLFKMASECSAEVPASVPKGRRAVVCLLGRISVLNQLSGMSYSCWPRVQC